MQHLEYRLSLLGICKSVQAFCCHRSSFHRSAFAPPGSHVHGLFAPFAHKRRGEDFV